LLHEKDIWCGKVLDYEMLMHEEGYQCLQMQLEVKTSSGLTVKTTRCPIRVDGKLLTSHKGAPLLGEDTIAIDKQFCIQ
jgi:crotonobetainyl-CoA:carnitine CoA-transferase CaiB-like acyl-CoA transferase